jgi:glutamyl-tRNA synthetase
LFDIDRINNSGAMFDIEKLKNFNAHYLRSRNFEDLFIEYILPNVPENSYEYSQESIEKIVSIAKERSVFINDLYQHVSYFFEPVVLKDDVVLKNDSDFRNIMSRFISNPCNRVIWTIDGIKSTLDGLCDKAGIKIGKIMPDLRMALSGGIPGPDLPTTMWILGPDESFKRIENLLLKTEKVAS